MMTTSEKVCTECNGTGWIGHGMGGDTCGTCDGKGRIGPEPKTVMTGGGKTSIPPSYGPKPLGGCPHCGYRHPPDGMCV